MLRVPASLSESARTDDPLLPVLQDPLCRAGQRDRTDRAAVRCAGCRHSWFQEPPALDLDTASRPAGRRAARPAPAAPAPRPEPPVPPSWTQTEPEPEPVQEQWAPTRGRAATAPGCGRSSRSSPRLLMVAGVVALQEFGLPAFGAAGRPAGAERQRADHHRPAGARAGWRAATTCSSCAARSPTPATRSSACRRSAPNCGTRRAGSSTAGRSRRRCATSSRAAASLQQRRAGRARRRAPAQPELRPDFVSLWLTTPRCRALCPENRSPLFRSAL